MSDSVLALVPTLHARAQAILGYAHFLPGAFTRAQGKGRDSDFFYLEVSLAAF